jgi:hypothetical protein
MNNESIILYKTWFGEHHNAILGYAGTDSDESQHLELFKIGDQWIGISYLLTPKNEEPTLTRTWVRVGKQHGDRLYLLKQELRNRFGIEVHFDADEFTFADAAHVL